MIDKIYNRIDSSFGKRNSIYLDKLLNKVRGYSGREVDDYSITISRLCGLSLDCIVWYDDISIIRDLIWAIYFTEIGVSLNMKYIDDRMMW